jgi:predicted transcriptional regulator
MMRWPASPRTGVLSELRIELQMLLLQLVLHKQVTVRRLARITERPLDALEEDLGPLVRMGLVRRDGQDVMHVDRYLAHLVTSRLKTEGMLA